MQLREARLSARSAEDVRLFTYITIVLLPLSFVAGLFSMQKAPTGTLTKTFSLAAFIALIATLLILFTLKTMSSIAWRCVNIILDAISLIMNRSNLGFWSQTRKALVKAEERNIKPDDPTHTHKTTKWLYLLFVVSFCFLELPTTRLLAAYDAYSPERRASNGLTNSTAILRVIHGFLVLPLFLCAYICSFILRIFLDFVGLPLSSIDVKIQQLDSNYEVPIREERRSKTDVPEVGNSLRKVPGGLKQSKTATSGDTGGKRPRTISDVSAENPTKE